MGNKYTKISLLQGWESNRHLCNLAVDRTGAVITDADVIASLGALIETASRDFDGHVEGYADVPLDDIDTPLANQVPDGVEVIIRGHALFLLWQRRGRDPDKNPHKGNEAIYRQRVKEIRVGTWKFKTAPGGSQVDPKPVEHQSVTVGDTGDEIGDDASAFFTQSGLKEYTDP